MEQRWRLNLASRSQVLSTTTKVVVDKDGNAHAESVIEAIPVPDLRKKARKSRESRGEAAAMAAAQQQTQRRVTYNERQMEQQFSPSAPPAEQFHTPAAKSSNFNDLQATPMNHSPLVRRNFSNASNIQTRPHVWQKKTSKLGGDRCRACSNKIKFGREFLKCLECESVSHRDCRQQVSYFVLLLVHFVVQLASVNIREVLLNPTKI